MGWRWVCLGVEMGAGGLGIRGWNGVGLGVKMGGGQQGVPNKVASECRLIISLSVDKCTKSAGDQIIFTPLYGGEEILISEYQIYQLDRLLF